MPPCGGAPYDSASSRKPNFFRWSSGLILSAAKTFACTSGLVDAHRAAADLPAVQHDVVGLGERVRRVGREQVLVAVLRRGERMVARAPGLLLVVEFEHREVDDPQRLPAVLREAALVADLRAQRAERVVDDLLPVGAEEDEVADLRAGALEDRRAARRPTGT